MLLVPAVTWQSVDDDCFEVALTDHGRTVTAQVALDSRGAPTDFSTTDRFCVDRDDPKRLTRTRWTTPVAGWQTVDGRPIPVQGQATVAPAPGKFHVRRLPPHPRRRRV